MKLQLCMILFLVAFTMTSCRTKKSVANQKTDIIETNINIQKDTTEEDEIISIVETRLDSNTVKKDIKKSRKTISASTGKNKRNYHKNDSLQTYNNEKNIKQKQQIKDLNKENKTLKKLSEYKLTEKRSLKERLILVACIITLFFMLRKKI